MSITVFLTLCVLGCDLLIYFLYQWVLGEKRRARLQREIARQRAEAGQRPERRLGATHQKSSAAQPVIVMNRKPLERAGGRGFSDGTSEAAVYRRLAASFAHPKLRT